MVNKQRIQVVYYIIILSENMQKHTLKLFKLISKFNYFQIRSETPQIITITIFRRKICEIISMFCKEKLNSDIPGAKIWFHFNH